MLGYTDVGVYRYTPIATALDDAMLPLRLQLAGLIFNCGFPVLCREPSTHAIN